MKEKDFGGCRCQAFLLAGDARAADPVCHLAPHHERVVEFAGVRSEEPYQYRG
jgi:pyrroloquinoline quinone biosynthesis protein E